MKKQTEWLNLKSLYFQVYSLKYARQKVEEMEGEKKHPFHSYSYISYNSPDGRETLWDWNIH